jgi:hypothetical protein
MSLLWLEVEQLLKELKDVFAWTYKDLKGIPLELAQHRIELDTTILLAHQTKYRLNPNYATVVKQVINKLFVVGFIKSVKEATWLSPIVVVHKKNGKLRIYIDFRILNTTTKKDPYPLPFTYEVLNTVARYEAYSFSNGYLGYHQISIVPEDRFVTYWGAFIWKLMSFGVKNGPPTYQEAMTKTFREYLDNFMKIFLDDFTMYSDIENHLQKLRSCFQKCKEYGISLNLDNCAFTMFSRMILGFIVSKERKLLDPKKIQVIKKHATT